MKKTLIFIFVMVFTVLASGAEKLNIYCTTFPVYLFTRNLTAGAAGVNVELMIPAGTGCPHDYVVTPQDLKRLSVKNLLVIRNGLGLDDFILKPLARVNPGAVVISVSDGIKEVIHEKRSCGHHHCHGDHGKHEEKISGVNPHLFASPDTALLVVRNIAAALRKQDPSNAALYSRAEESYLKKLNDLKEKFTSLAVVLKGKHIAVQHDIFAYLARLSGLHIAAEISKEGVSPSASEMRTMVRQFKKENVVLILTEPQYPDRTALVLSRECRIPVIELDPVASGPADAAADHYEKVMNRNFEKIRKALVK